MAVSQAPEPGAVVLSKMLCSCVGMLAWRRMAVCVLAWLGLGLGFKDF
jgi:hypothetical protein